MFPFKPVLLRLFYEQALPQRSPLMYLLAAQQFSANVNFKDDTANKWLLALHRGQSQWGSINNQWQHEGFHPSSHNSSAAFHYQTKWKSRLRQRAACCCRSVCSKNRKQQRTNSLFSDDLIEILGFHREAAYLKHYILSSLYTLKLSFQKSFFIVHHYSLSALGLHGTTLINSSWNIYCRLMAAHKHLSKVSNLLFSTFFVWDKHTYMLITSRHRHIVTKTTLSAREQRKLSSRNCGGPLVQQKSL